MKLVAAYRAQVEAKWGPCQFELAHRWVEGGAELWKVRTPDATHALKIYVARDRFEQELRAYQQWLSKLAPDWSGVPQLQAALPGEPGALVLSWVDGEMWLGASNPAVSEHEVYAAAGRSLAKLHGVDCPELRAPRHHDAVRTKTVNRAEQLRAALGERVYRWAIDTAESDGWDKLEVGYCHRDYSPRNWLVEAGREPCVTVIDFEHAQWDYRCTDVMKLWDGPFIGHAERRRAFYAGYGRRPEEHLAALRLLAAPHGLAIVLWSQNAANAEYLAHGLALLQRCSTDPDWMWAQGAGRA